MTTAEMVLQFHRAMGIPANLGSPRLSGSLGVRDLRQALLTEEYQEYLDAETNLDLVEIADALADMVYIIYGTAWTYGIPLDAVIQEVHRSNMTKIDPNTGTVLRRADGKILKPVSFSPPDIPSILGLADPAHVDARV
jgi:predicted HAD superfamily Cof-like phosphohydrolase